MSRIRHAPVAPTQSEVRAGGDVIDRHHHDDHQLIYVSSGVLAIRTGDGAWVAARDRAVWIPAGVWHEHRFHGRTHFHTIGFPADPAPLRGRSVTVVAVDPLLRELIIASSDDALPPAERRRLLRVLRDRLVRAHVQPLALPAPRDRRLAEACRLVEADLSRPRTLGWLAANVATTERTLSRLFRAEFGTTYPQWRTTVRVFHAMVRLADGASVTRTAYECGWATPSAFIDTFAGAMGRTPGHFRPRA